MSVETKIFANDDGRHCLTIMDGSKQTFEIFDELELQGGGYTWEAIINGLAKANMPGAVAELDVGAEADNAYVYSTSESTLRELQKLIVMVDQDSHLLRDAIAQAGENLE